MDRADFTLFVVRPRADGGTASRVPTGPVSLLDNLEVKGGYSTQLVDLDTAQVPLHSALTEAIASRSDPVGVSCMIDALPEVLHAVRGARESGFVAPIILGGPGPGSAAENIMRLCSEVDHVAVGESETSLVELMDQMSAGSANCAVPGVISRRTSGSLSPLTRRPREHDLDSLYCRPHSPARLAHYGPVVPMEGTRGCLGRCGFCAGPYLWQRSLASRSPESLVADLARYADYGYSKFHFVDDSFTSDRRFATSVCRGISRHVPGISWHCCARGDDLDDEMIEALVAAGCSSVFVGVEAGSPSIQGMLHKPVEPATVQRSLARIAGRMHLTLSFIWGYPFETLDDFRQTVDFALSFRDERAVSVSLYKLAPLPRTLFMAQFSEKLILKGELVHAMATGWDADAASLLDRCLRYPDVYASFYEFLTPDLERKQDLLDRVPDLGVNFYEGMGAARCAKVSTSPPPITVAPKKNAGNRCSS
jgi:radical SAM superfamily enzyme YgiQ (UPF0313 family)